MNDLLFVAATRIDESCHTYNPSSFTLMFRITTHLRSALSADELNNALQKLPGWKTQTIAPKKEVIAKEFVFADFKEAWAFMGSLYQFIDTSDHHPEWSNVYNRVHVMLTTHDVGNKVSTKDVQLAEQMEMAAAKLKK